MKYLEECLTLGDWLSEDDRLALYKYFLQSNSENYRTQASLLLQNGKLTKTMANGEISYLVKKGKVNYSARKLDSDEFTFEIREIRLTKLRPIDNRRLKKFFAQSDVDVIHNFPLPGLNPQSDSGFGINVYPYYDPNYYSNGKSRMLGFVKRIRTNDGESLNKLKAV
jgi:hypothetical protein